MVFGGFAPPELATRIDDAAPKAILCASCGIEVSNVIPYKPLVDEAIDLSEHKPAHTIVLQRPEAEASLDRAGDQDWDEWLAAACAGRLHRGGCHGSALHPLYLGYHR